MSRNAVRRMARGFLFATLLLAGCKGGGVTPIKTLLDDPSQYDHKTVRIAGTVEESAGLFAESDFGVDDVSGVERNAIVRPSGDHAGDDAPFGASVSARASPPSMEMT